MDLAADFDAAGAWGYTREPRGAGVAMLTKDQIDAMVRDACIVEARYRESEFTCDVCCHVRALAAEVERLQAIVDSHHEEERAAKTGVWRYIAETYEGE
jgi:hypothetical protein